MAKLIDGNTLYEKTAEWEAQALHMVEKTMNDEDATEWKRWSIILRERSAFKLDVANAPTVDAVPVVRCKECEHGEYDDAIEDAYCYHCRYDGYTYNKADHFCSDGERKGGDE